MLGPLIGGIPRGCVKNDGRLRNGDDFRWVRSAGNVLYFGPVVVYQRLGGKLGSRLGVVARVRLGGAVVRNRAKRRIRAAWHLESDALAEPRDVVIVARSSAVEVPFLELRSAIRSAMGRSMQHT